MYEQTRVTLIGTGCHKKSDAVMERVTIKTKFGAQTGIEPESNKIANCCLTRPRLNSVICNCLSTQVWRQYPRCYFNTSVLPCNAVLPILVEQNLTIVLAM